MTRRTQFSLASVLTIVGGGLVLSTPAQARDTAYTCEDSVQAYCEYAAGFCESGWARCYYTTSPCTIERIDCL